MSSRAKDIIVVITALILAIAGIITLAHSADARERSWNSDPHSPLSNKELRGHELAGRYPRDNNTGTNDDIASYLDLTRPDGTATPHIQNPGIILAQVHEGDTLSQFAHDYGTTVENLVTLNDIRNPDLIYKNTYINLPIA